MAITFVTCPGNSGKAVTSLAITFGVSINVADWIIVPIAIHGTTAISTVTDSLGNNYSLVSGTAINNGTTVRSEIWSIKSGFSGTPTVTVTPSASATLTAFADTYRGVSSLGNVGTNTGASTTASVSLTTQDPNNFMVASIAAIGVGTFTSPNTGSFDGQTTTIGGGTATNVGGTAMHNTVASPGSLTCSATITVSETWAASAVELRNPPATVAPVDGFKVFWMG